MFRMYLFGGKRPTVFSGGDMLVSGSVFWTFFQFFLATNDGFFRWEASGKGPKIQV